MREQSAMCVPFRESQGPPSNRLSVGVVPLELERNGATREQLVASPVVGSYLNRRASIITIILVCQTLVQS